MPYHVIYSLPEAAVYEGPGDDPDCRYDTFEEARDAAIASDLEHWLEAIQGFLADLKAAKSMGDLPRYRI